MPRISGGFVCILQYIVTFDLLDKSGSCLRISSVLATSSVFFRDVKSNCMCNDVLGKFTQNIYLRGTIPETHVNKRRTLLVLAFERPFTC